MLKTLLLINPDIAYVYVPDKEFIVKAVEFKTWHAIIFALFTFTEQVGPNTTWLEGKTIIIFSLSIGLVISKVIVVGYENFVTDLVADLMMIFWNYVIVLVTVVFP